MPDDGDCGPVWQWIFDPKTMNYGRDHTRGNLVTIFTAYHKRLQSKLALL